MIEQYSSKAKDVVIILDCSIQMNEKHQFHDAVELALIAFDDFIKPNDRVAFMICQKNVYAKFSLVEKWKNTENLRNQISVFKRETNTPVFSKHRALHKALIDGLSEFTYKVSKDNDHWIIVFTCGADTRGRISMDALGDKIKQSRANILMANMLVGKFDNLITNNLMSIAKMTRDGIYMENFTTDEFRLTMTSICTIDIPFQPIIMELFT